MVFSVEKINYENEINDKPEKWFDIDKHAKFDVFKVKVLSTHVLVWFHWIIIYWFSTRIQHSKNYFLSKRECCGPFVKNRTVKVHLLYLLTFILLMVRHVCDWST